MFDDDFNAHTIQQKAQLELQLDYVNLNDCINSNITINNVNKALHRAKKNKAVLFDNFPMKLKRNIIFMLPYYVYCFKLCSALAAFRQYGNNQLSNPSLEVSDSP